MISQRIPGGWKNDDFVWRFGRGYDAALRGICRGGVSQREKPSFAPKITGAEGIGFSGSVPGVPSF